MKPFEEEESSRALETINALADNPVSAYNLDLLEDALITLQSRIDDVRGEVAVENAKYAAILAIQEYFTVGGYLEISDNEGDIHETVTNMNHFENCVEFMK